MLSFRYRFSSFATCSRRLLFPVPSQTHTLTKISTNHSLCSVKPIKQNNAFFSVAVANDIHSSSSLSKDSPFSGLEDVFVSFLFGKKKATDVAHMVWKHVVQKGDTVIDATCGNGFDTLELLNLVADDSNNGYVYALDIQKDALAKTSLLLDESLNSYQKHVKLFNICHSKMEEVVQRNSSVRLVAFNLGYLPGGDKEIITRSETTLQALEAAERVVIPGGLISIVVYVGHPGGRICSGKKWRLLKLLLLECLLRIGSAASYKC
ncbi:tRNA (mnm(5)s(2)U34)-methyltransferase, chloroplastic-like isoform X2 [Vicia villosa]|uniref:tRNA (mnm(5)s(2)U34)-methyltransferase, chloroplastic-like isoform X2 n=1 Tax=Vicia villosa TaxID=3911 RepID=UPI00273CE9D8|nr:tRNA (mnm(5)s(2)U34)-methyltransferase, chloroplastic-like isoform X2 [Vicia villosa]